MTTEFDEYTADLERRTFEDQEATRKHFEECEKRNQHLDILLNGDTPRAIH